MTRVLHEITALPENEQDAAIDELVEEIIAAGVTDDQLDELLRVIDENAELLDQPAQPN